MTATLDIEMGDLEEEDERGELEPLTSSRGDGSPTRVQAGLSSARTHTFVEEQEPTDTERSIEPELVPSDPAMARPEEPAVDSSPPTPPTPHLSPEELLFAAVYNKDFEEVESILREGVVNNINYQSQFLFGCTATPLHVAASGLLIHCTQLLLAAGADPNICDDQDRTAMDLVGFEFFYDFEQLDADSDNSIFLEVIRLIHDAGGKHNTMRPDNPRQYDTPLHTAVKLKDMAAFRMLIDIGAYAGCLDRRGQTPLHKCVEDKFVLPFKLLLTKCKRDCLSNIIDHNDNYMHGRSVLHEAVCEGWLEGVRLALEFGADITKQARDGDTPLHAAAAGGNVDILKDILIIADKRNLIGYENRRGETAFFEAVSNGHTDCVEAILDLRPNTDLLQIRGGNVFHVVAKNGDRDMFWQLKNSYLGMDKNHIISLHERTSVSGLAPLHYAVSENRTEYVTLLKQFGTSIALKTVRHQILDYRDHPQALLLVNEKAQVATGSTALHITAMHNYTEIAELLCFRNMEQNIENNILIHEKNSYNEQPLHTAIRHHSSDVIKVILRQGASLISYYKGPLPAERPYTALYLLINSLPNPAQLLEEVFDSYISTNNMNLIDPDCEVKIDYSILMPDDTQSEQLRVIEALLDTGNKYKQERLLMHPLVESFLHLQWKSLRSVYWVIIALYLCFVISLSFYSYRAFYNKYNSIPWMVTMYCVIALNCMQEFYAAFRQWKSDRVWDHTDLELWIKLVSVILAAILPTVVAVNSEQQWPRHVATGALLLAWIQVMIHVSKAFGLGHYVMMFGIVSLNVCKILITFAALLIGFSLCFTIQFQSESPFNGTIAAFFKTMVMMTSEFDYGSLFDEEKPSSDLVGAHVIFLIFMVLAAIAFMNFMTGVAVNDISNLELLGNIEILKRQVRFLATIPNMLPVIWEWIRKRRDIKKVVTLRTPRNFRTKDDKDLDLRIRNATFEIVELREKKGNGYSRQPNPLGRDPETAKELKLIKELLIGVNELLSEEMTSIKDKINTMSDQLKSLKSEIEVVKKLSLRNRKGLTFKESVNAVLNICKDRQEKTDLNLLKGDEVSS